MNPDFAQEKWSGVDNDGVEFESRFTNQQMVDGYAEAEEREYVNARALQRRLFDYVMDEEWLTTPVYNVYAWGRM